MHLDDERVQRLIDGELAAADEQAARDHLSRCDACAAKLAAALHEEGVVRDLLDQLDAGPVPETEFASIARASEERRPRLARWAAGLAIVAGLAGAAYALPGSPLPRWIDALVEWGSGRAAHRSTESPVPSSVDPPSRAGIGVAAGDRLVILFIHAARPIPPGRERLPEAHIGMPHPHASVVIRLTEGDRVEVRAPRDAATFASEDGKLVIHDRGAAAAYEIDIPRTAPRVEVLSWGVRRFVKEGTRVTTSVSAGEPDTYRLPLAP